MDVEFSNVSLILLNVAVYAVRLPPVAICKSLKILYSLTIISIIHSNDYPHNQLNFKKDVQEREKEKIYLCE